MIVLNLLQGSNEWLKARCGKITGTKLQKVMSRNYVKNIKDILSEKIVKGKGIFAGVSEQSFTNEHMERGHELEEVAIAEYEKKMNCKVERLGLCISDKDEWLALSPDGFTNKRKRGVEVKCPIKEVHAKYIKENRIPTAYKWQVVQYFLVNEIMEDLDFISYCQGQKLSIFNVKRSDLEKEILEAEQRLIVFRKQWSKEFNKFI